jgi:hypothetical protein
VSDLRVLPATSARLVGPVGAAAAGLAAFVFVGVVDPNKPGRYPTCPFLAVTGHWCPGCGTLRAMHALARGDLATAAGMNGLAVLSLPLLGFLWWRWTARAWSGAERPRPVAAGWIWALLLVIVVFGVVRNLPFGAALAP